MLQWISVDLFKSLFSRLLCNRLFKKYIYLNCSGRKHCTKAIMRPAVEDREASFTGADYASFGSEYRPKKYGKEKPVSLQLYYIRNGGNF